MIFATLTDRTVIAMSGEDRIAFLQGLITNDATLLTQGQMLYTLLLSPQGKFLHDFFLIPEAERILIDVNSDRADDLLKRLQMYKLRSKVVMERTEMGVTSIFSPIRGETERGASTLSSKLHDYEQACPHPNPPPTGGGAVVIKQIIYVQREAHKKMVIGVGGAMIKRIGSSARRELEKMLEKKVHLALFVKVKSGWKDDRETFRLLGLQPS